MDQPKKLRDILLEYAVYYFHELFLEKVTDLEPVHVRKDILLPCGLFESILDKSKEIQWTIPYYHLKLCLASRDVLRWLNIDLVSHVEQGTFLDESDLTNIANSSTALRSLRFYAQQLPPQSLLFLSKVEGLEILDIRSDWFIITRRVKSPPPPFAEKIEMKNLQELSINCLDVHPDFLANLDLDASSMSLKTLKIECISGDRIKKFPFLQKIGTYKNLQHLTLSDVSIFSHEIENSFLNCEVINFFKDLKNLQSLTTLELLHFNTAPKCGQLVKEFLDSVKSIKNLDLSGSSLGLNYNELLSGRKFNYLGLIYSLITAELKQVDLGEINADRIAGSNCLENLVTCLETFNEPTLINRAMVSFLDSLSRWESQMTGDLMHRIKKVFPKLLNKWSTFFNISRQEILFAFLEELLLDPIFMEEMCMVAVSSMKGKEKFKKDWGSDIPKILKNDKFFECVLEHMIRNSNSDRIKSFLSITLWFFDERVGKCSDNCKLIKSHRVIEILEKMMLKKEKRVDEETKRNIKTVLEAAYKYKPKLKR